MILGISLLKRVCDKGEGTRQGALYALCRGTDSLLGILGSEHIEIVPRQLEGGSFTRVQLPSLKKEHKKIDLCSGCVTFGYGYGSQIRELVPMY